MICANLLHLRETPHDMRQLISSIIIIVFFPFQPSWSVDWIITFECSSLYLLICRIVWINFELYYSSFGLNTLGPLCLVAMFIYTVICAGVHCADVRCAGAYLLSPESSKIISWAANAPILPVLSFWQICLESLKHQCTSDQCFSITMYNTWAKPPSQACPVTLQSPQPVKTTHHQNWRWNRVSFWLLIKGVSPCEQSFAVASFPFGDSSPLGGKQVQSLILSVTLPTYQT